MWGLDVADVACLATSHVGVGRNLANLAKRCILSQERDIVARQTAAYSRGNERIVENSQLGAGKAPSYRPRISGLVLRGGTQVRDT